jgi:catechol 2,3-dioxygenase-like lactoylglutathione lyase family enzyme
MEPRLNVITLAVDDLGRALVFYRDGLGLQTKGVASGIPVRYRTRTDATFAA